MVTTKHQLAPFITLGLYLLGLGFLGGMAAERMRFDARRRGAQPVRRRAPAVA